MTCCEVCIVTALAFAFNTNGIRRTPTRTSYCLTNAGFKVARLASPDQSTKSTFGISCCGVDKYTLHRESIFIPITIDPLSQRCTSIATVKTELSNEKMSKRMYQDKLS